MVDTTTSLSADRRFRESFGAYVSAGLCLSVGVHLLAFLAFPALALDEHGTAPDESMELVVPPDVRVPPPPEDVARPAEPRLSDVQPPEESTIEPTVWDRHPAAGPPPPPEVTDAGADRPPFVPRDVEPRLENRAETQRALRRYYPDALREAGIEATVVLWIFVDRTGAVTRARVHSSSGYESVDAAAAKVARTMEFAPALNRDRAVGVWVRQAVRFQVR